MRLFNLGDADAFDMLYRRYSSQVFGYLRKRLGDSELVQDIFQETFLKIHRYRAKFDPALGFQPWLFTLCRNTLIDGVRAKASGGKKVDFEESMKTSTEEPTHEHPSFEDLVSPLSEREKEVLSLRYEHDLSFSTIGDKLGLSLTNVRKIASRAVARMRSKSL